MNLRTLAIIAAISATTFYGINHTVAKEVMPLYVQPYGFIMLRVIGAAAMFWLVSLFGPKEKIDKKDYRKLLLCALLGMGFNMLAFFKGLALTTPINSSVMSTTIPIIVMLLSFFIIKEKSSRRKLFGITIGLLGALGLIFFGAELRQNAPNIPLGNSLILVNSILYGAYLVLAKTLISKYHPFTFMKWLFTLGIFICLPFGYQELIAIEWANIPLSGIWRILFVIIGTTFCTYLFNIFALTQLKASTVSAFVYVQPLVGIGYAVLSGQDSVTTVKIVAACLVLLGVYLASRRPKSAIVNS